MKMPYVNSGDSMAGPYDQITITLDTDLLLPFEKYINEAICRISQEVYCPNEESDWFAVTWLYIKLITWLSNWSKLIRNYEFNEFIHIYIYIWIYIERGGEYREMDGAGVIVRY